MINFSRWEFCAEKSDSVNPTDWESALRRPLLGSLFQAKNGFWKRLDERISSATVFDPNSHKDSMDSVTENMDMAEEPDYRSVCETGADQ